MVEKEARLNITRGCRRTAIENPFKDNYLTSFEIFLPELMAIEHE